MDASMENMALVLEKVERIFIMEQRNELVSIIMLSRNKEQFLVASVRSIMAQTYQNWELLFVDDASKDDTIGVMLKLKYEDEKRNGPVYGRHLMEDGTQVDRISVTRSAYQRGETMTRNSALKDAKGKWIAFLDAGDIWEPTKLEKQVAFMEEHGFAFSYTKYKSIDAQGRDLGIVMSGPEVLSYKDIQKCCWMGYLTVMYDATKIGLLQVDGLDEANDYALWLQVARKAECHLLPECLASQMSEKGLWHRLLTTDKWAWRYEAYRKIERMNPIFAAYMVVRNMAYAAWKWGKYAERV